jgi:FKBP-type peptidyl-prolyl cis-trans isomerase FkpA
MKKITVFTLGWALFLSSCNKENDSCNYDSCGTKAPDSEIATLQNYITSNSIAATMHCSGVFYSIQSAGTTGSPTACSNISVTYKGMLTNGTIFDQTATPVGFNLGMLVPAWRNVLPLIKGGGRIIMYVPPTLGYGSQANGPIPANSILIFEVDLVTVY